ESDTIAAAMSAGDDVNGSNVKPAKRSLTSGSVSTLAMSWLILAMIAGGVPRGASNPTQALTSNPAGRPPSATVGTDSKPATRMGAATAMYFTLPARYMAPEDAALPNDHATSLLATP